MGAAAVLHSVRGFALKAPPAFSYETKRCNASTSRVVLFADKLYESVGGPFGESHEYLQDHDTLAQEQRVRGNVMKVAGYIPLVGCGVAVWRVSKMRTDHEFSKNKFNHVLRAIIEFLGLGLVCLPVDLYMTAVRQTIKSASDGGKSGRLIFPDDFKATDGVYGNL